MTDDVRPPAAGIGDDAAAEAARRGREVLARQGGTLLTFSAGWALLLLRPWTWSAGIWLGAGCFVVALAAALWWQFGTGAGRHDQAQHLIAEHAVLHHVDPGVGRRVAADEAARRFAEGRRIGWLFSALPVLTIIAGRWDRPAWAVPGAVLLVLTAAVQLTAVEREARAGRRWLADPPAPPRD